MIPPKARDANTGWPDISGGNVCPLTPERLISVPMAKASSHKTTQVQTTHFGTIFISSRKRNRSLFLRNRISFMRSSNASLMLSSFSKILSLANLRLWQLLGRDAFFPQSGPRGNHWGNAPPENEAGLENQFRCAGFTAEPFDTVPDPRRCGYAKRPGNGSDGPDEFLGGFFFSELFGAHTHAELSAAGEV